MEKEERPIVIKRRIKRPRKEAYHGGAWKVAYADFITALMALFLVLWLIAVLSVETREAVAKYFRSSTIFKGSEAGGAKGISIMQGNIVKTDPESGDVKRGEIADNKLAIRIGRVVEEKLSDYKDQVLIFVTNEGVRIELVEKRDSPMFELGKAGLLPMGREVLQALAGVLNEEPRNIIIEGHTDNYQYQNEEYTNWELAADRANAARRELLKEGLNPKKVIKVTSFADVIPIKPDKPYDPMNRRVSILMKEVR